MNPRTPLVITLLWGSISFAAPTIVLDTIGGDAWTFAASISGRIDGDSCDEIDVASPAGTVNGVLAGQRFTASVPLLAGNNEVVVECRRSGHVLGEPARQHWRVPLPDSPKAWIRTVIDDGAIHLDGGRTERARGAPAAMVRYEWFAESGNPSALRTSGGPQLFEHVAMSGKELEVAVPEEDGEYYVRLRATDALNRSDEARAVFRVSNGRAQRVELDSEHPRWVDTAVLYGATPYVFEPQSFEGVRERLDEMAALGVTALWLSPVTSAAEDDFGYAVTDHFSLRSRFGDAASFRRLIAGAHRLGLKVIVDFVPNHVSERHAYHAHAARIGMRSPYYDWFDRDDEGKVTQYFDWSHLKNLEYDNPEVQNYMIEAFSRFVRDFGVDGFRIDASWAVARRAPEFWPRLREELKRIDPNLFLLAEASAREPYHVANGFDAAYDWTNRLGEWAWHDVFDEGRADLDRVRSALTNDGRGFPPDTLIMRFINNNDTGERFISRHGLALTKLAATLLFTLPGIPLIYNGDEIGAEFEPYDEGPPLNWNVEHPLTAHYRMLASLRREARALHTRELKLLKTNHDEAVLAYLRPAEDADDLLVIFNFGKEPMQVSAGDAETEAIFRRFARSRDLLTDASKEMPLQLEPSTAMVLSTR